MAYVFYASTILTYTNFIKSKEIFPNSTLASFQQSNFSEKMTSQIIMNETNDKRDNKTIGYLNEYSNDTEVENGLRDEDYAEFSSLHPNQAKTMYHAALKKQREMAEDDKAVVRQARQSYQTQRPDETFNFGNKFVVDKAMDLMTQSVYATRRRLQDTRPLREKMTKHMEYSAALLYGALMQLRIKMDNVYTTMKKFKPQQTKFMWYLVLYERCLSFNTDVTDLVKEFLAMNQKYQEAIGLNTPEPDETDRLPPWLQEPKKGR